MACVDGSIVLAAAAGSIVGNPQAIAQTYRCAKRPPLPCLEPGGVQLQVTCTASLMLCVRPPGIVSWAVTQ